jgi:hypothetical protein
MPDSLSEDRDQRIAEKGGAHNEFTGLRALQRFHRERENPSHEFFAARKRDGKGWRSVLQQSSLDAQEFTMAVCKLIPVSLLAR